MSPTGRKKIYIVDNFAPQIDQLVRKLKDNNYLVEHFESTQMVLEKCQSERPNIILLDWALSNSSGKDLFKNLKSDVDTRNIPIMILTREVDLEDRLDSLSLEIDDYVAKPFYAEEVIARIETLFQDMELVEESRHSLKSGFMGHLSEMNLVDLIQTVELGKKSGIINLTRGNREGQIFFKNGHVIDAIFEGYDSQHALTHMLTWLDGTFWVTLKNVERTEIIQEKNRDILKKGTQLIHQVRQLSSQLPPMETLLTTNKNNGREELSGKDSVILSIFKTPKSIEEGIKQSHYGDVQVLERVKEFLNDGYLIQQEKNADMVKQGTQTSKDSYTKVKHKNGYSRVISFFRTKEHKNEDPKIVGQDKKAIDYFYTGDNQFHRLPHSVQLTKAELMLLAHKINADNKK